MIPDKLYTNYLKLTTVIYLLAAAVLFPYLKTKINPDGIAYLTIAKNYAHGHFQEAVSAYWSPLISWILAPFSYLPVELLFIFYGLNVLFGCLCLVAFSKILDRLKPGPVLRIMLLPVCAVFMLRFAYYTSSPDLLSLLLLLAFLYYWLNTELLQQPVRVTLFLVLLYFAKAYNLFFVLGLVCFEASALLLNGRMKAKQVVVSLIKIFALFFIIISPWLIVLHQKYGGLMLAGTAKFNHSAAIVNLSMLDKGIAGTENLGNNYEFFKEFSAPPHEHSIIPWEDPVMKAKYTDYDVFASANNFMLQNRVIGMNLQLLFFSGSALLAMAGMGIITLFACFFIAGVNALKSGTDLLSLLELDATKLLVFNLIYLSGYLLLFIEDRYLWILIISGLLGIGQIIKFTFTKLNERIVLLIAFVSSTLLLFGIIWKHFFYAGAFNAGIGRAEYVFGKKLVQLAPANKRMVHWPATEDNSLYVSWFTAYFSGGRHYNCLPDKISAANNLISENDLNIVFVSDTATVSHDFVIHSWNKIRNPIPDTDVYIKP